MSSDVDDADADVAVRIELAGAAQTLKLRLTAVPDKHRYGVIARWRVVSELGGVRVLDPGVDPDGGIPAV